MAEMRRLKEEGFSVAQISAHMIIPEVGKGKKGKKALRDAIAQKLKKSKKAKEAEAATEKDDEEESEVSRFFNKLGHCLTFFK